ncbi:uncharacterized protein LOC133801293 [Humulus lupulus]|uniref:uncharacterized protein LOC133801293 n=1 Tax=Humulus lupulus TaxID=3486 RepID=UPI002B411ABD|nr:uncharacterized protein LOC133801293 [Humulus lupulus]
MDGKKQVGSSSTFTSELFGSKESSSSSGIFGSIFAPSSKVLGRESLRSEVPGRKHSSFAESYNTKHETSDDASINKGTENQSLQSTDTGSIYQEQRMQPCHLSSSIYYGGQDVYCQPQTTPSSTYKQDGAEDDSGSASRGNWWQGSLYY